MDDHTEEDSEPSPHRPAKERDETSTSIIEKDSSSGHDDSCDSSKMFEESFINGSNSFSQDRQVESKKLDAIVQTLEQANNTIRRLHGELHPGELLDAPVVTISDAIMASCIGASDATSSPADSRADDNFTTEWADLSPALNPPPPEHGLRSPVVTSVLNQWTNDRALHNSLMRWMERVLTEDSLDVPPLTIPGLDQPLRDGFTTHVLPLLLQRVDIGVSVQTRSCRRTSYDLAVRVSPKEPAPSSSIPQKKSFADNNHDTTTIMDERIENSSVANSAVTEQIVNGGPRFSNVHTTRHREINRENIRSPCRASAELDKALDEEKHQNPNTIMGTLGGALGGFMNRTKPTVNPSAEPMAPPPTFTQSSSNYDPYEQPYHRVVSAPPGRIGVTFVNFQGHAMVSDVSPNSPLSSWIFASDILIAIDEVPVSGMRVRDIIKVLTNRKDRQRALRVISSHAMNESILNETSISDCL